MSISIVLYPSDWMTFQNCSLLHGGLLNVGGESVYTEKFSQLEFLERFTLSFSNKERAPFTAF